MGRAAARPPFGMAKRGDPPDGGDSRRLQGRISAEAEPTAPRAASPLQAGPKAIATATTIPTNVERNATGISRPDRPLTAATTSVCERPSSALVHERRGGCGQGRSQRVRLDRAGVVEVDELHGPSSGGETRRHPGRSQPFRAGMCC